MPIHLQILLKASGYELNKYVYEQWLLHTFFIFSFLIILIIVFILFYLLYKESRHQRCLVLQQKFNDFISEIAIAESKEELEQIYLQPTSREILLKYQKTRLDRNLLITQLAETCKKFSGVTLSNIHWLFGKLQLEKELLHNLNNVRWYIKAKAVQQLAYLKQQNHIKGIFQLTNHKNNQLRMEAQVAIVKLTGFEGLQFLDVVKYPVSEWQQLRLIQELSGHSVEKPGNINGWLKSKNNSVAGFALRLIEIYRLYEFYDEVTECLSHPCPSVCSKAVATIGQISNETTARLLTSHYPGYNENIQLQVLKMLQSLGTGNEINFLLSLINNANDTFKVEAAKAILHINATGIEKIKELGDENSHPINYILPQLKMENII